MSHMAMAEREQMCIVCQADYTGPEDLEICSVACSIRQDPGLYAALDRLAASALRPTGDDLRRALEGLIKDLEVEK